MTSKYTRRHLKPNHQRWHAKSEAQSECVRVWIQRFRTFGRRLACSVGARRRKVPASELSRRSVKSALLVGKQCSTVVMAGATSSRPGRFFFLWHIQCQNCWHSFLINEEASYPPSTVGCTFYGAITRGGGREEKGCKNSKKKGAK